MKVGIKDIEALKTKALRWADGFSHACYLDSNGYHDDYSSFDCLIAAGAAACFRAPSGQFFERLERYLDQHGRWLLGYLGYDLKNETEAVFSSNPDTTGLETHGLFIPKHVLIFKGDSLSIETADDPADLLEAIETCPAGPRGFVPFKGRLFQRMSKPGYINRVKAVQRHIARGDIYELNFCQEFYAPDCEIDPLEGFLQLKALSPTPFSAYLKLEGHYILCASPERFMQKTGRRVISQPIKGTIRRGHTPEEDNRLRSWLQENEKERAENIMIVDLVRNDLSKYARRGSVKVEELCGVRSFEQWHQMVSTVSAQLKEPVSPARVIKGAFPMGSMTGAPKVRAMELIEEFETVRRGAYSGTIGYFSPGGNFDLNVVIRSLVYNKNRKYLSCMVGSAITANSIAANEYEECLLKARAIMNLFEA